MKKNILIITGFLITTVSCSPRLTPDHTWSNQRWVLTELKTTPVQLSGTRRDAYLEFFPGEKRFSGNGGCNRISGKYVLENKNRIQFGEVISTKMSCPDIAFETAFLSALTEVNRFEKKETTLVFRKDGEIILKFEARPTNNPGG